FLAPDLSFAGYLGGPRVGAIVYNAVHTIIGPLALASYGVFAHAAILIQIALIWLAHIGFDHLLRSEEHTSELQSLTNLVFPVLRPPLSSSPLFPYTTLFRSFLAPDLSFAGYLGGPRVGAIVYNAVHTIIGPLALASYGVFAHAAILIQIALIWLAHIGFDHLL